MRERRQTRKLTQTALARAVGISASYLNLIEHNRRGIAGRTLLSIARELDLQPSELTEGADASLINALTETAKSHSTARPEVDRIEEFVGRYPGWAKLLGELSRITREQRETLTAMTDQMAHDPFISETMHQILSNITAIRSTASILATAGDIPADMQARFLANLHSDSQRLSETAQKMVDFFDHDNETDTSGPATAAAHEFWASHDHVPPPDAQPALKSGPHDAPVLHSTLERYQSIQSALPAETFAGTAASHGFDPLSLARHYDTSVMAILFRMAQMPADMGFPVFGLIEVDMSGAVLMRKPTPELALPLYSSACPLWPIYRAFAQPGQVLRATLEMPSGDRVLTYALSEPTGAGSYDLPALLRSTMIFSADNRVMSQALATPVLAGLHCSVCPRKHCEARRVDYILA
ncbi:short-chain fatty acyl-CoA regulator family protein [Neptunicoccus sediminis]|uniref:short-chain fatty acyl-CoA regulator family protein n=1 Tax=Neptunicoccus sediminis TaxID=1892596 RepID=UPI0024819826|nr:short-chain fatty acyl-CoA regulator family protein [Neptunicoccus sediminis]